MHNDSHPEAGKPEDTRTPVNNAVVAMKDAHQRIGGDVVNKATQDLPDEDRSLIRRWHAHYIENEMSIEEAGRLIGLSGATASLVMRGKYPSPIAPIVKQLAGFFDLMDKRSDAKKLSFITTGLTKKIWDVCDLALEFQRIAFIFGDQQIGKSEALEAYQRAHNHGSTIYVSLPTGGALLNFMTKLARTLRIPENLSITKLRERIINAFDHRMLLIVDEAHRCIRDSGNSTMPIQSIEFVREIFDEKKCGVVICATNVFRDAMQGGAVEKILRQTRRRRLCALQLPNVPTRADLNKFAAAYGLPPASGEALALETAMVDQEALGMWLTLLRMAAKLSANSNATMTWKHVLQAKRGLEAMEKGGQS